MNPFPATRPRALSCLSFCVLILLFKVDARAESIPVVDLSGETKRHVVITQGTPDIYQGHPTTLLLPDGRTMYATWTLGHGGVCGPMKRSTDGGLSWISTVRVDPSWGNTKNCPSLYRLTDPQGVSRLFVFAGQGPDGKMHSAHSLDHGYTWTPMRSVGLECVMPFCTIVPVEGDKKLIGLSNIRRPGETQDKKSNVVTQSESTDGGLTWSPWRILVDLGNLKPCEPEVVRSPDGKELLCMMRENVRSEPAHFITSWDEGRTWSGVKALPPGLHGDRHKAVYTPDGRLVVCFRDMGAQSPTRNHFVAWVGRYQDIVAGRDGEYKVKLLHSHARSDCGYPGLEILQDGTLVATTYVKYKPGPEKHSVVSVRFSLAETDKIPKKPGVNAPAPAMPAGVLMDDSEAAYTGQWEDSSRQPALVGRAYKHDKKPAEKNCTATFTPDLPQSGRYEVRLLYVPTTNRATNVRVTVRSAEGEKTVEVSQKDPCLIEGIPNALGVFEFAKGKAGSVTVSNANADGYVVVDGMQFVPEAVAEAERATRADAGFPTHKEPKEAQLSKEAAAERLAKAAAVAYSPLAATTKPSPATSVPPAAGPVQLAKSAKASEVDGKAYDVVVVGGTAAGVVCAVRASMSGAKVLLVQHNRHLGGMLANGLMQWDALYGGRRSMLMDDLLFAIERDAIERFGQDSEHHQTLRHTHEHYPIGWVEPHVMERQCNRMIAHNPHITLLLEHYPVEVRRQGAMLESVTLRAYGTTQDIEVKGATFVDATYEGDLMAAAKVPWRAGREARAEYGEPHAGKVFVNIDHKAPQSPQEEGLNLHIYNSRQGTVDPASPFSADGAVQAYNYRFCVTRDPANRILLTEPPPGYNREEYLKFDRRYIGTGKGPNLKSHMNSPILPGENHGYPDGTWEEREKIIERHKNFALGLMWFLQNDPSLSLKTREGHRIWGLAKDEFPDNNHLPYEMYVREARRLVGRYVITEHDFKPAPGYARTPIQKDSIAFTDWYQDSHSCTLDSSQGYRYDGKLILTEQTRPTQIPWRALLPKEVDNLIVPVCLSATHVAWGAIRLEPVWMQTGEAAGLAAGMAHEQRMPVAHLDPQALVVRLVNQGQVVTFFNDLPGMGGRLH